MSPDTILVIEDNPDDLFFLKRAFKESGLANPLEVALDGAAGLAILVQTVEDSKETGNLVLPLLVLLDLKLPIMNGFEVLEGIRKIPELAKLIVVVLTSSDVDADVCLAYELGARSFVVKPPKPGDLVAMVKTVSGHASRGWLTPLQLPGLKNRRQ